MRIAAVALLAALVAPAAVATDVDVYVEPATGITDADPIQLIVRIEGEQSQEVSPPDLPTLQNLDVRGGPAVSNQFQWINGQTRHTVSFVWTLLARKPGPASIPAFEVRVANETFHSEPIRLEVAPAPRGRPAVPDKRERPGEVSSADVFVEASVSKKEAWVGEPVTLSLTLYSALRIDPESLEPPSLSGFWVEQDEVSPQAESGTVQIEGRRYWKLPVYRAVLIPQSAGELAIEPFVLQSRAQLSRGFFGRVETVIRKSEPLAVRARPLPESGRPEDFSGAVGSFEMSARLDRQDAAVDEAVALKVEVWGDGFLKPVKPPAIDTPPDLKVFPPQHQERTSIRGGRMHSRKSWEWVLVPLAAGEMRVPALGFSYFDVNAGEYRSLSAESLLLTVRRGERGPDGGAGGAGGELRAERRDIAFIKVRDGRLERRHPRVHHRPAFLVLAALPLLLAPAVVLAGRRRARLARDRGLARARKARARARQRLRSSRRRAATLDSGTFHEEVARTLVEFVADRFNLAPAGLTYDRMDDLLVARGVDPELRRGFRGCLEACDFARFVPSSGSAERRREVLDQAGKLIEAMERAL